ncbi:sigma factor [Streptomyces fuscigenes]|uniref:sigma factor n=1 Tax=Streptomyces fuscigenes TaxID=1528880 RepID=UPI001F17EF96|nr:sigma factor [Streptomyces fuscigenes]MCF3965084.1 RNA polymerase subunit sigma-70 [Streptomyces fuscigenes]
MAAETSPRWDRRMQQRLARAEEAALGELYDRFASTVHSLAHRVLEDDAAADEVTREVFAHAWQHPEEFAPDRGTLRSWLAGLASERAVARLRAGGLAPESRVRRAATAARADFIVTSMPAPLRDALDSAYRLRRSYRQTARDLNVTEDEARRRLRLGLQLLSSAGTDPGGAR